MKLLQLLPIGDLDGGWLMELGPALAETFHMPCEVMPRPLDPQLAFHGERQQYHSSELLHHMQRYLTPDSWRILGVTAAAPSLASALANVYAAARKIHFDGMHYRTDIAAEANRVSAAGD